MEQKPILFDKKNSESLDSVTIFLLSPIFEVNLSLSKLFTNTVWYGAKPVIKFLS